MNLQAYLLYSLMAGSNNPANPKLSTCSSSLISRTASSGKKFRCCFQQQHSGQSWNFCLNRNPLGGPLPSSSTTEVLRYPFEPIPLLLAAALQQPTWLDMVRTWLDIQESIGGHGAGAERKDRSPGCPCHIHSLDGTKTSKQTHRLVTPGGWSCLFFE